MDLGKWLKDRKKDVEKRWQNSTVLDAVSANTEADKARRAQQVAKGNPLSVNQQASQTYGSGFSAPVNRLKDLWQTDTQADAMKRLSQTGLSETYDQQQKRLTNQAVNTQSNRSGINQFARSGLSNVVNRVSKFPSDAGNLLAAASKSDILQNVPILGTVSKFDQATGNKGADFTQRKAKQLDQFTTNKLQQSQLGERKGENKTINMVGQLTTDLPLQAATGGYGSAVIGANMASSEYNKARDAGKSNDYALAVGALQGGASALSEKYGIDKFLPGNGVTGNIVTRAGKRFLTEGAQEAQQQFTQNLIANKSYNPNQGLTEGVAQSAILGGVAGAGMSPVLDLASNKLQAPPAVKQQVVQAKPVLQQTGIPARPGSLRERIQVAKDNVTDTIASSITPMDQAGAIPNIFNRQQEIAPTPRANRNELGALKAYLDGYYGITPTGAPTAQEVNLINRDVRIAAERLGIPLNNGLNNNATVIREYLDTVGTLNTPQYTTLESQTPKPSLAGKVANKLGIKPMNEGGYAKNPFYDKKNDVAKDLSPEQSDFINEYANMLKNMGQDNGVDINPMTGARMSNNVRTANTAGKAMTEADWFNEARKQIESGKGAYGASEDYKALATPQVGKPGVDGNYKDWISGNNTFRRWVPNGYRLDDATGKVLAEDTPQASKTATPFLDEQKARVTPTVSSTQKVGSVTKPPKPPVQDLPSISTRIAESKKKTTSSSSSLATSPETSVSSPRSSGQETLQSTQPTQKTQVKKLDSPQSSQALSYNNSTPKSTKVKLNTSRLNPDSGYAGMAEMDKQTSEVIESLSNKDIVRLSKDAGIDTKTNSPEQVKKKIAEQLNVRRDAVKYMNDAEVARKSGDTKLAQELMLKAAEQGKISRAQGSELAQQLQARRIIANELDTPQQRLFKLLDAAGVNQEAYVNRLAMVDFNDGKQVIEAYRDLVPAKKAEWLDTVRYNSMLSSPLTQVVNIFGNAQGVLGIAPIEKTIRGSFDAIAGTFGKERQYAAGEGLAYSKGAVTNLRNATIEFKNALTGTGKYANPDFQEYSIPLATKGMSGATYKALLFPMRVLDGMDKFFRTMASAGEESALNLREKKGIKLGGNKQALMEGEAAYRVFQQELNIPGQGVLADASDSFAGLVMSGRNSKNPVVSTMSKFTVPFVKTINNINKQGMIEYSPLGVVNMIGNTDKVTALTRATMGTAVFGLSSLLLAAGDMTWGEPRGPEERARFRSEGKQPYAVKIGGKWVGFSKLHPAISFPMAMTSAIDDAMKDKKLDQGNVDAIMEAVSKYGNFLSDQSYAKSVGDMLGAIGGDKEAVARAVSNNIQQVVPFRALTGWMGRMTDDLERKVDTSKGYFDQQVELLMQQYPGLRQKTNTRDYKGQPIPANNPVLNGISPVRITDDRGVDPLDAEMDKLKAANEKDPLLSDVQVKDVDKVVESRLSDMQRQLVNSADYQNLSDKDKASKLSKIKTDLKAVERKKYMAENQVGEYSPTFSGKESKLTADQRALAGGNFELSRYGKSSTEATDYATKYKDAVSAFERDKNTLSPVQRSIKQKELRKLGVQKDYDNDTVSLHGMSKKDVYGLVSSDENGNDLVKKLLAYDDALVKSGVLVYNKWRDKNGNPDIAPRVAGGKGGKKSDGTLAANSLTTDTLQKLNSLLAGTQKPVTGARKVAVKKATLKKITVKK